MAETLENSPDKREALSRSSGLRPVLGAGELWVLPPALLTAVMLHACSLGQALACLQ